MPLGPDDPVIRTLCLKEMGLWLGSPINRATAAETHAALNETLRSVFLLRIADGEVTLLDKPGFKIREAFHDPSQPEPVGKHVFLEEFIRAKMYREFFARILAGGASLDATIAIDVNDAPHGAAAAPVFAFQRRAEDTSLLMPDIDFLHNNFYLAPDFADAVPYADKRTRAVFAGATTGGRTITSQDVEQLAIPRLRAGMFFKTSRRVDFRIPKIVQVETEEVAAMIRGLGINNRFCSWPEQFASRFILSMDGNGATCSRVAIALRSQAALVKYDSPWLLFYFGGLVPWRHYIPVETDEQVERVVEAERQRPGLFADVAAEGRSFARRYLGRAGIARYMVEILGLLDACLSDRTLPAVTAEATKAEAAPVELCAHIQDVGDVSGWPGEWVGDAEGGRAVEAILLDAIGVPPEALRYRVVLHDGSVSDFVSCGTFCGSRGANQPIRGFEIETHATDPLSIQVSYRARFADGTEAGPLSEGLCQSASGAALVAFQVAATVVGDRRRGARDRRE